MRPDNSKKLRKIRKVSIVFGAISVVLSAVVAFLGLAAVVCVVFGVGGINYEGGLVQTGGLSLGHRLILGAVTGVAWAALFKCFYHLWRLFGNYSRGEIFTRESVGQLRLSGIACLLWGVLSFLWLLSLAASVHPTKSFQGHFESFSIGAVLIVIARFMDMAVDLREENELTI
jgi:hypothetical protein